MKEATKKALLKVLKELGKAVVQILIGILVALISKYL